ncbi:hypothetical protein D3C73_1497880 [compost metagenome]
MRVSQHTAQASAKALLGTRLYIVDIGKLHIPWAPQVVDLKMGGRIRPSVTQLHNMAAMPRCVFGVRFKAPKSPSVFEQRRSSQLCG